jgi:Bacterial PH domain
MSDPAPSDAGNPAVAPALASSAASIQETVFYEGGPALGDLILNLLFGLTLIGLPFAVGAVVRALWLRFRITSRRISVSGGWLGRDRTQVVYNQIREVRSVPRGFGAWGDMVLVLEDGARLEMRAVPRFRELEAYIEERRQARAGGGQSAKAGFAPAERRSA